MANLKLFALIFTAIVAFSTLSAYGTRRITTTIKEDNSFPFDPIDGLQANTWINPALDGLQGNSFPFDPVDGLHANTWIDLPLDGLQANTWINPPLDGLQGNSFPFDPVDGLQANTWINPPLDHLDGLHANTWINPPLDGLKGNGWVIPPFGRLQVPIEQLNHCVKHLTLGIDFDIQQIVKCCSQLKKVSKLSQCAAIQQVFEEARRQGGVLEQILLSKARALPYACNLQVPSCPPISPSV